MRENVKALIAYLASKIDLPEPILEIGSLQVEGQEGFADLRPFFPNKEYIGCDMRKGLGVDSIENIEKLNFKDESVGTILIIDTIEHVALLHKCMEEIYRVLKMDGWVIMSSVMDFPIHDYPEDYWRFTPKGFKYLLKDFPSNKVFFQGPPFFPHTVFGIAKKVKSGIDFPSFPDGWIEIDEEYKCIKNYSASSFFDALKQIEETKKELTKIKQSWSWRLTAPLRGISSLLISLFRGRYRG